MRKERERRGCGRARVGGLSQEQWEIPAMCAEWDNVVEEIAEGVKRLVGVGREGVEAICSGEDETCSSFGQVTADNGEQ